MKGAARSRRLRLTGRGALALAVPAVQVASPSHHNCSTPTWKKPMADVASAASAPNHATLTGMAPSGIA